MKRYLPSPKTRIRWAFNVAVIACLVPSYMHASEWFEPAMPKDLESYSWIAGLIIDVMIWACGATLWQLKLKHRDRGTFRQYMWGFIVLSIYVNWRWDAGQNEDRAALSWDALDALIRSAALPVFAAIGIHLRDLSERVIGERGTKIGTAGGTKGRGSAGRSGTKHSAPAEPERNAAETVLAFVRENGPTHWRDVSRETGASKTRIYAAQGTVGVQIEKGVVRAA